MKGKRVKRRRWWTADPGRIIESTRGGDIVQADALDALSVLADECIDIAFLDPPFNLGKNYGLNGRAGDRLSDEDYYLYMTGVLAQTIRTLKPGAAFYMYHIPRWAIRFAADMDHELTFRHWIAISMKNGFVRNGGLYPAHYALLYFTKGSPAVANRPKIQPATCPHCDEYTRDYGGYRRHIAEGVNLSDVWEDLSPVRHAKYKSRSANELPLRLTKRVVQISGMEGGVLLDPFAGTGASIVAARHAKMKFIAIDREKANCDLVSKRVAQMKARGRRDRESTGA